MNRLTSKKFNNICKKRGYIYSDDTDIQLWAGYGWWSLSYMPKNSDEICEWHNSTTCAVVCMVRVSYADGKAELITETKSVFTVEEFEDALNQAEASAKQALVEYKNAQVNEALKNID